MGAKIGILLNCGQQSQFSKVRREFDAGRVNLDPPMTCADWPVPGNLTLLHPQTAYTRKPLHRRRHHPVADGRVYGPRIDPFAALFVNTPVFDGTNNSTFGCARMTASHFRPCRAIASQVSCSVASSVSR